MADPTPDATSSAPHDDHDAGRRRLLKAVGATVGAVFADLLVPAEWAPAWMHIGVLPAHAACSRGATAFLTGGELDAPFVDRVQQESDAFNPPRHPFELRVGPGSEGLLSWTGGEDLVVRNVGDRTGELWLLFRAEPNNELFFLISDFELRGEGDHEEIRAIVSRYEEYLDGFDLRRREAERVTVTTEPTGPGVLFRQGGLAMRTLIIPIPAAGTLRIRGAHLGLCTL